VLYSCGKMLPVSFCLTMPQCAASKHPVAKSGRGRHHLETARGKSRFEEEEEEEKIHGSFTLVSPRVGRVLKKKIDRKPRPPRSPDFQKILLVLEPSKDKKEKEGASSSHSSGKIYPPPQCRL
jgi:hypothetical protein